MEKSFDKHLNIFMTYGTDYRLENNITKAFINTLMYSDEKKFDKIEFIRELIEDKECKILEKGKKYHLEFDLQNPYNKEEIKKLEIPKYLIGLSPCSEEEKGVEYFKILMKYIKDKKEIKINEIVNSVIKEIEEKEDNIEKNVLEEIKNELEIYKNRGGSIPDGWIFLYDDEVKRTKEKLKLIIAIENKLTRLDNSQLLNHVSESLGINKNPEKIIKKRSFETVTKKLEDLGKDDFMIKNFSDYMLRLGYIIDKDIEKITDDDIQYLEQNFEYDKNNNKIYDMSLINKKLNKIFEVYKNEKEKKENMYEPDVYKFTNKNWIKKKNMKLNLTYYICNFNEEKNAILIALEIGVQDNPKISSSLENIIRNKNKNEIIEMFSDTVEERNIVSEKIKSSYNIYLKIRKIPAKTYYEIENKNVYQKVEDCVEILKKSVDMGFYKKNLSFKEFKEIAKEKIQKEDIIKEFGMEKWNNTTDKKNLDLITYLRFIDYIPYSEICNKDKNEIFDIIDKVVEKQLSKAKRVEEKLNEI